MPIAAHKPGVPEKAAELAEKIGKVCPRQAGRQRQRPRLEVLPVGDEGRALRLEIGPKDLEKESSASSSAAIPARKIFVSLDELETAIPAQLEALRRTCTSAP